MRLPTALLALAAALTLAACGSDDEPSAPSTTGGASGEQTSVAPDAGAFPVTLATMFGDATIDAVPERVATVGFNEQDFALALGVKPVAVREALGSFDFKTRPWAPGANSDPTPAYVGSDDISFEKVAAARPDVILGIYSFMDESDYGKLSGIAPTVAQTKDFELGAVPWDRQLLATGKALGRETRAKEIVAEVDGKFAAARKEHPEFEGKELTVAYQGAGSLFNLADSDLRQQFFTDLGFETPKDAGIDAISKERLDVLDKDVLVLISQKKDTILQDPQFRDLKAVKEGRVIVVGEADAFAGALGFNSPLSRPYLLEQAVSRLAAAADGDPATEVAATQ